jgi:acyl-CoA dehydrogenase
VLAEEVGRALAAVPFTASACGFAHGLGLATATQASDACAALWPRLVDGSLVGVLLTPDGWHETPHMTILSATEVTVSGTALHVLDGAVATHAMACIGSGNDARLVLIDLASVAKRGLADRPLDLLHPTATLVLEATPVHVLASGATALQLWDRIFDSYALFTAFEQLGSSEAALQMAREHSLNRYAFGRPIGSFQAIKHMLADMLVAIDLARSNCYFGAGSLSMERDALRESSAVARISATDAFRQCARGSIQVHGALGVTWESSCHLYYRRAQALAASPGSLRFWKERLIELLKRRRLCQPSPRPSPASGRGSGLPLPGWGEGWGEGIA